MIKDPKLSAIAYWQDQQFHFCCEEDDCYYDQFYDQEEEECYLSSSKHDWEATLFADGTWQHSNKANLTDAEIEFWCHMADCFRTLPAWYFTDLSTNKCYCALHTLIQKGCQCGGE